MSTAIKDAPRKESSAPSVAQPKAPSEKVRFDFIDGIRGTLVLWVIANHIWHEIVTHGPIVFDPELVKAVNAHLLNGDRTSAFFVVSAFCMMLSVPPTAEGQLLRGGVLGFIYRRFLRIVPTYWCAIAFVFLMYWFVGILRTKLHMPNGFAEIGMHAHADIIVSHIFLIHNWWEHLIGTLCAPYWMLAIEWQMYFLFGLILLPFWRFCLRKWDVPRGLLIFGLTGLSLSYAILLLPYPYNFRWSCPWFIGLYCLGMVAGTIARSPHPFARNLMMNFRWGILLAVLMVAIITFHTFLGTIQPLVDILVGPAAMCALLLCTQRYMTRLSDPTASTGWVYRLLRSNFLTRIGLISYSIYLTHYVVFPHVGTVLKLLHLPTPVYFVGTWIGGYLVSIIVGYFFYLAFEKTIIELRVKAGANVGSV